MITSENDAKYCMRNGMPNETVITVLEKRLKVYKKALDLACDIIGDMEDSNYDSAEWKVWLLQTARKEE